ncbi:MAG: O-antigen ligase family protein [Candidatus Nealsonbacteria bacterium]
MGKQSREKKERKNEIAPQFKSGLEKICLFVIQWGAYLALFSPLIINTKFFFPFVAPKTIFFRILIEIILVAYIFLVMVNKTYRPRINPLTIAIVLFLAIFVLASFTGINLHRSFWSTNERMTGILTMMHLLAFFIILSSVWRERRDWERALGVSVIVGVALSLYILLGNEISTRGGGTIGNTSFMAAYLLFNVFFAVILLLAKRGLWQIFAGISLLIMTPVLLNSTGRGAIVAFFGGLFLLGLGFLFFSQKKILKRSALAVVLILIILGISAAVFQPSFVKDEANATLKEMKSRFVVWETGWKGFLEKPILGWGPENFIVVFSKYFNSCMFLPECGNEIWFDRVHNIVLDTLVTTGIIGLLSYLAIFGVAIYGLLKTIPKIIERKNIFFPLGLIVVLSSYFFQNLLVFDMINTYLVFFLTLGFINFLIQNQKQTIEEKNTIAKPLNPVFSSIILIAACFILWSCNIQPLLANHSIIKTVNSQDVESASLFFEGSLDTWMEKYEPREYFAQKMIKANINESIGSKEREIFQAVFDLAEAEMENSVDENRLDFRPHLFLGELYLSSYRFSDNQEKILKAEQILEEVIQLSPTNQQGYWNLAEVKLAQGNIGETLILLRQAVELEPRLGYAHWYLAMAYSIAGQNQLAKEEVIRAGEYNYAWRNNIEDLRKVIEIYNDLGDDNGLVSLYLQAMESMGTNDAQLWAELAAVYANLGQFDKASEAAQKVIAIDPSLSSRVEKFLKALPQ